MNHFTRKAADPLVAVAVYSPDSCFRSCAFLGTIAANMLDYKALEDNQNGLKGNQRGLR